MIDFDEELKKFHPREELEDLAKVVNQQDLTDLTDVMREMMKEGKVTSSEFGK